MNTYKSLRNLMLGLCVIGLSGTAATAGTVEENLLLRVEVNIQDGPEAKISIPVSCLDTLLTCVSDAFKQAGDEMPIKVEELFDQIASAKGVDLVKVSGEGQSVRVWVDEVDEDNAKELNFLRVYAKPEPGKDIEVNVNLPKGLIEMVGPMAFILPQQVHIQDIFKEVEKAQKQAEKAMKEMEKQEKQEAREKKELKEKKENRDQDSEDEDDENNGDDDSDDDQEEDDDNN